MRRPLASAVAAALLLGAAVWTWRPPSGDAARQRRAATITLARPHWSAERVEASMKATDAAVVRLAEAGVTTPSAWVAGRLREVTITETKARAFHAANSEVFGGRPYEASRSQVDDLLRIQRVRAELGAEPPPNGLRYPGAEAR